MAESKLMRVSTASHNRIAERARDASRTLIAEHDRIVDAGISALEQAEKPPARKRARAGA
jgi:hypothetical protein